jgi:hypothetical protein
MNWTVALERPRCGFTEMLQTKLQIDCFCWEYETQMKMRIVRVKKNPESVSAACNRIDSIGLNRK